MTMKADNGARDPRLDRLYGEAPRDAPPAHIDAAILAAARREVGARPRPLLAPHGWRVAVSLAAVVVLSVTLVTLVGEEGGETLMRDAPPQAVPPEARTAEPAARPDATPEPRPPAAAPEAFSARRDHAAGSPAEPGRAKTEAAPDDADPAAGQGMRTEPAPESNGRRRLQPLQDLQRPPAEEESASQAPSVPARHSAPEAAVTAAPPSVQPKAGGMLGEPAFALRKVPVWHGLEQEPPAKWLERAAELKRQGRSGEAEELIAEFKRRFHDTRIPPELE